MVEFVCFILAVAVLGLSSVCLSVYRRLRVLEDVCHVAAERLGDHHEG